MKSEVVRQYLGVGINRRKKLNLDFVATLGKRSRFPFGNGFPIFLENAMSQEKIHRSRSRRFGVEFEEEKVWVSFYRRVLDPSIAVEVLSQLESDPELKRTHLALYLRCKESLRSQKIRNARNKRIGQFVRMLCNAVFVVPVITIWNLLRHGGNVALECMPEVAKEPATPRVGKLSKNAEVSQEKRKFAVPADEQAVRENDNAPPASQAS
jgi:hypothetical protein